MKELHQSSYLRRDITASFNGKCYTQEVKSSDNTSILLNPRLRIKMIIHDPNFFLITVNPSTIPAITLELGENDEYQFIYIDVVRNVKMNTKKQPCERNETYSFTACVKNHVSNKFGCRLSTNHWNVIMKLILFFKISCGHFNFSFYSSLFN